MSDKEMPERERNEIVGNDELLNQSLRCYGQHVTLEYVKYLKCELAEATAKEHERCIKAVTDALERFSADPSRTDSCKNAAFRMYEMSIARINAREVK